MAVSLLLEKFQNFPRISEPVGIVVYPDSSIGEEGVAGLQSVALFILHSRRAGPRDMLQASLRDASSSTQKPADAMAGR